jgi:hypothetical protein
LQHGSSQADATFQDLFAAVREMGDGVREINNGFHELRGDLRGLREEFRAFRDDTARLAVPQGTLLVPQPNPQLFDLAANASSAAQPPQLSQFEPGSSANDTPQHQLMSYGPDWTQQSPFTSASQYQHTNSPSTSNYVFPSPYPDDGSYPMASYAYQKNSEDNFSTDF